MTQASPTMNPELKLDIHIEASPEKVWKALTDNIGEWWPSEFFIGGKEGERSYHLEAKPGGHMYETYKDGGGLVWGTVAHVIQGELLQLTGHRFPRWAGPTLSFYEYKLTPTDSGCTLSFSEASIGNWTEKNNADMKHGWTFLFDGVLKAYCEGREKPSWGE